MLGFTCSGLYEQALLDLSEDCTRNFPTQVPDTTKGEYDFIIILSP